MGHPAVVSVDRWITVGGIGQKEEDVQGRAVTRHYLNLTVSIDHNMVDAAPAADRDTFRKEIAWREFSYHLLANHPDSPERGWLAVLEADAALIIYEDPVDACRHAEERGP